MEITALCTIVASLRVTPSSTQFFRYESVKLSCGEHEKSSEWKVKRNTSTHINEECSVTWGNRNESQCFIDDVYPSDTGVYWCESGAGECSNAVNITVTDGFVILESPVLPVQEGEAVTLRCTNRMTSSSNLTAEFYKDGLLIRSSSTGNMTIHNISKSDEGLYKCNISGARESPDSWLAVRARHPESFHSPLVYILLPVVGVCLSLASVMLLCLWRSRKGKIDSDVLYTDVTITQEVQPKRDREMDDTTTFYSTIKPGAS
ncbi:low affinity immunoglobulin gamma Fc region receptor II-c-like [Siniperca chuatsi]|uniref:low affinity immunoglobulin gamma Fc region receptor II-c-like n=1 Tax=Siniperca chuatsi TaxID=119488 RepID=UPI001CE12EE6|nr:low affinity immunoglobulin gamma Fc region receptor II-c-like [Siniperca chuatsi]